MSLCTTDLRLLQYLRNLRTPHIPEKTINQVENRDAWTYLSGLPNNSVGMIFTDEPYAAFWQGDTAPSWDVLDSIPAEIEHLIVDDNLPNRLPAHLQTPWVYEAARVLQEPGVLINFGNVEYTGTFRDVCRDAGLTWKASGPWIKTSGPVRVTRYNLRNAHEHFFVAVKGTVEFSSVGIQEMMNHFMETECPVCRTTHPVVMSNQYALPRWFEKIEWPVVSGPHANKTSQHPTEKPEWLVSKLLQIFNNVDHSLVDPFCGSGSIPAAAKKAGWRVWANDYNQEWAEYTKQRLEDIK